MSEKARKNILVLIGIFEGHIPGILEIVKDLKSIGHNVTCYVLDIFENRLKQTGAKLIPFSKGKFQLPPDAPPIAKKSFLFSNAYDEILSKFLECKEKYDFLLYDSFFDGKEINKIFKIPTIISVHIFPVGEITPFVKDGFNHRMIPFHNINKKYNLNIREFLTMHYLPNSDYKLILTSKYFHPEMKIFDDTFYFIGPSIEERPIDNSFNFKKDEKKKLIYISLGTTFNNNIEFYKMCIETFKNMKEFQIIMSVGNMINIKDLGDISDNIFVYNFTPQLQILKETDVFITHGGINSINEAFFVNKIPLIVIPQQLDQFENAKKIEEVGAGIALDNKNINEEILKNSVFEILKNNEKYKSRIEPIIKSFKDSREERKKFYEKIFN